MAKQLNIFLENRPGRMASVTEILFKKGINIRAITIQDRGDFGMMKILVDKPQEAHVAFSQGNYACTLKEVLAIRIEDRPGGLYKLAAVFAKHGVNILDGYGYVVEPGQSAVWCLQAENLPAIRAIVEKEGFKVLDDSELYAM